MIHEHQQKEGWGAGIIPRLAKDIRNDLPGVKGFSERNIGGMIAFYRDCPNCPPILPQAVAKLKPSLKGRKPVALTTAEGKLPQPVAKISSREILQQLVAQIPWGHNILLMILQQDNLKGKR